MNATHSTSARISLAPLYWLALGTFAVGTESFMIAGLLPDMAADLHTSIVATGQLVTVFALAYAFSSPVLTALTGGMHRRTLMILSLSAFTLAANSSTLLPATSKPMPSRRVRTSGVAMALRASALMRWTIGPGMPAGPRMPNQVTGAA